MAQPPVAPRYEVDAWEEARQRLACTHSKAEIRYKENSVGQKRCRSQCLLCGRKVEDVTVAKLSEEQKQKAKVFDEAVESAYYQRVKTEADKINQERRNFDKGQFHSWYEKYLKSTEWLAKRDAVLKRTNNLCEGCLIKRATQAHHLTYARVGHEMLFDLVAVCDECHNTVHFEPEAILMLSNPSINK
jgi:5-methylcytosine-specific restriction endonuclease McrA